MYDGIIKVRSTTSEVEANDLMESGYRILLITPYDYGAGVSGNRYTLGLPAETVG